MRVTLAQSEKIQVLRGVAIIAVVCIHNTPPGLPQVFCRPFLNFTVGLFLFLSGMLSSAEKWNPLKRIVKTVIPYILWTLVYTVIYSEGELAYIPVSFVKNAILGNAAAMMYYVFVYCEFTLLIPLIDELARSRYRYLGFVITPIEIIAMRLLPVLMGREVNGYISILMNISCLGWFTYFYLGYLLGNNLLSVKIAPKKAAAAWVVALVLEMAEGYGYYLRGFGNCGTQLKLTSVLAGVLVALMAFHYVINGEEKEHKVLKLLGNNSFGIYFAHIAVMELLKCIPGYVRHVPYPMTAVAAITVTMVFVLLSKKILGKYSAFLAL